MEEQPDPWILEILRSQPWSASEWRDLEVASTMEATPYGLRHVDDVIGGLRMGEHVALVSEPGAPLDGISLGLSFAVNMARSSRVIVAETEGVHGYSRLSSLLSRCGVSWDSERAGRIVLTGIHRDVIREAVDASVLSDPTAPIILLLRSWPDDIGAREWLDATLEQLLGLPVIVAAPTGTVTKGLEAEGHLEEHFEAFHTVLALCQPLHGRDRRSGAARLEIVRHPFVSATIFLQTDDACLIEGVPD